MIFALTTHSIDNEAILYRTDNELKNSIYLKNGTTSIPLDNDDVSWRRHTRILRVLLHRMRSKCNNNNAVDIIQSVFICVARILPDPQSFVGDICRKEMLAFERIIS